MSCPTLDVLVAGGPAVAAHLVDCARCRIELRLWELDATGSSSFEPPTESFGALVIELDSGTRDELTARIEAFEALGCTAHWRVENDIARVVAPDARPVPEVLVGQPGQLAFLVNAACDALATIHAAGLAHGALGRGAWVTESGRILLAHPDLHRSPDPADDVATLGRLLTGWVDKARDNRVGARYVVGDLLGRGGMGEVFRAEDTVLERTVAIKLVHAHRAESASVKRFVAEGQITAQLQHPGIVPVHDLGTMPDGRPFYTMMEVRGVTLREAIRDPTSWGSRRLVDAFGRVCDALAYAHARGVLHRDLKPSNVMLGGFGEVRVMDWGLAVARPAGAGVVTVRDAETTNSDAVAGTPCYMPPEQARGGLARLDARADVYALGAMLYEILAAQRPYWDVKPGEVVKAVLQGPPSPLASLAPDAPEPLVALVTRCMAREPAERPADANEVARAVRAWLEGAERRDRAEAAMASVGQLEQQAADLRASAQMLRDAAAALLEPLKPWEPVALKAPAWEMEDQATEQEHTAAVLEARYEQGVRAALKLDPGNRPALDALAALYKSRLLRAEGNKHHDAAARYATMLENHDAGRHRPWLRGDGAVSLVTDPPGARVLVERYEEIGRRLEPVPAGELGVTPLREVTLPRGSYRLRLVRDGCEEVRYPVFLERGEHWHGVPPEGGDPFPVLLPPGGSLGPDDCYVPAGWFWSGGDPEATDALPRRRLWVDGLVVRRFPVTFAEYAAFLDDLMDNGREVEAQRHVPALTDTHARTERLALLTRGDSGRFDRFPTEDAKRRHLTMAHPASCISWGSAMAFAAWTAERTTEPWRLPHDQEWEKSARGVDGRRYPWGDHFDPTWACVVHSHAGEPSTHPVRDFPLDDGPYGIRGAAGNVRDWCVNGYERNGPEGTRVVVVAATSDERYRMVRGGSFSASARLGLCPARLVGMPGERAFVYGVRLLRPIASDRTPTMH